MQLDKQTSAIVVIASLALAFLIKLTIPIGEDQLLKDVADTAFSILIAIPSSYLFLLFTEAWTEYRRKQTISQIQRAFYVHCQAAFNVHIHTTRALDPGFDREAPIVYYYTDWTLDQIADAFDVAVEGRARRYAITPEVISAERQAEHAYIAYTYVELIQKLQHLVDVELSKSQLTHEYIDLLLRFRKYLVGEPEKHKAMGYVHSLGSTRQEFDYKARLLSLALLREEIREFEVPTTQ